MKHCCRSIALLFALFAMGSSPATSQTAQFGCFVCANTGRIDAFCKSAREGDGWICITLHIADDFNICRFSGGACLNPYFEGGGGAGGGSGGGGNCHTTGACPAECFTCSGGGGRPRI